ncbi:hypothetical protein M3Y97_00856600 [Aphelenchoides bicaudatus]|nr:hypothetical protein M3Y97_00856600 [Aphelenchoides bicaudatus]
MTADPQFISNIYRRLQNGFCPAVSQVSQSGINLLKVQSAYSKAFDSHLICLQDLAKSGNDVSEDSTKFTSELAGIISALQQINREEEKLFVNFSNLMAAVTKFSESEKDRLKDLNIKYLKDEKALGKSAKRTGDNVSFQEFYNNELKKAKEQHSQRYAYFAKNYLELLRKQATISKRNSEIAEKLLIESDMVDVVKNLDKVVNENDTVKSNATENLLIRDENNEMYEQPIQHDPSKAPIIQHNSVKSQKAEDRSRRASNVQGAEDLGISDSRPGSRPESKSGSRPHTAASRMSSASGLGGETDNHSYEHRHSPVPPARKVLSPNIYKATPILGLVKAELEEQQQHQREQSIENADPNKIPRANINGDHWNKQDYDNPNKKERDYFDAIPRPDYVPEQKVYDPVKEQAPVSKPQYQPTHVPKQPEIAPRNEERPPPKYVKPAEKPQQGFNAADYGRTLEATQSYSGQTDHQLSLNAGDQSPTS